VLPAQALRRIGFLLEAEGAATYKVQAFRRAAATVEAMAPGELERLNQEGRLATLKGIGDATAAVISQALAGEVPDYLSSLEGRGPSLAGPAEQALLEALRGDCHSHSDWSDGGSPIEEMARAAADLGREYLALTDHSPRLKVARGLSADSLRRQLQVVAELNERLHPFRLLRGIEVDILEDGSLDQEDELLAELDVVVASVHSALRMEGAQMTRRMVVAVSNPLVDVLGHCTGRLVAGRSRPQSDFDPSEVFGACAAHGTAVEINSRPDRLDPPVALVRAAASAGCGFAVDSDAHAPGQLSWLHFGCQIAVEAGLDAASIVNTRPLDDFLAWTARAG